MPRTAHTYNNSCPIPQNLSNTSVIAALHRHENLFTLQPLVSSYREISSTSDSDPDPFFDASGSPIKTYEVTENVVIVPGIGKWGTHAITIILYFQDVADGVKSSAVATGVVVRSTFTVNKSDESSLVRSDDDMETSSHSSSTLSESSTVECSSLLMPFVKWSMERSHQHICRKLLERIASQQ